MAGYFVLELDTTGPQIEIHAPRYTDRQSSNVIRIVSNEKLSNFQDIYIIDSQGTRHDVTFSFNGDNEFIGSVVFNDYSIGVTTVFAQVKDEVGNVSNLATVPISVLTPTYNSMLRLSMSEDTRDVSMNFKERTQIINGKEMRKTISEKNRKVTMSEKTRTTIVSDTD